MGWLRSASLRVAQVHRALRPAAPFGCDSLAAAALAPPALAAYRAMPAVERAHGCRVADRVGADASPELFVAALLHDLGKNDDRGGVRLHHRVGRVVLGRVATGMLRWPAVSPAEGWRRGWVLAVHHPVIGARRARDLGCRPRAVWLIANHERRGVSDDPELALLQSADAAG